MRFLFRVEEPDFVADSAAAVFLAVDRFWRLRLSMVSLSLSHAAILGANSFWHFELT
jgi:hypothetical protein